MKRKRLLEVSSLDHVWYMSNIGAKGRREESPVIVAKAIVMKEDIEETIAIEIAIASATDVAAFAGHRGLEGKMGAQECLVFQGFLVAQAEMDIPDLADA